MFSALAQAATPASEAVGPLFALATNTVASRSISGQFLVHSSRSLSGPDLTLTSDSTLVPLDPARLLVSCERIKQKLLHELGVAGPWRGKIFLERYHAAGVDEPVALSAEQFRDGWHYRVDLPDVVEPVRFVRAMVQVLLLELANRDADEHSAEIPLWLSEGLAQQLLSYNDAELIPPAPHTSVNGLELTMTRVNARRINPLEQALEQLRTRPPLSFEELSWPTQAQLSGDDGEFYRRSAQLFVAELLCLKDGRACLRAMLADLPRHYNWQFAFLRAFHAWFDGPLDVEKWWGLHFVHFTARDLGQTWAFDESLDKLEQTVRSPVQVRTEAKEMPLHGEVTLQTIIRDWEGVRRTRALQAKVRELELLRLRVARTNDLLLLVDGYHEALATFLRNHFKLLPLPHYGESTGLGRIAEETLKRLDELDARRAALRRELRPVAAVQPQPRPELPH